MPVAAAFPDFGQGTGLDPGVGDRATPDCASTGRAAGLALDAASRFAFGDAAGPDGTWEAGVHERAATGGPEHHRATDGLARRLGWPLGARGALVWMEPGRFAVMALEPDRTPRCTWRPEGLR